MRSVVESSPPTQDTAHKTQFVPEQVVSAEPSRILVIDSNLLTAEAIVVALTQMQFAARFVVPVTAAHVREFLSWHPGLALIDIDAVDNPTSLECVRILHGAAVPTAVMGGRLDVSLLGECIDAGASSVVDKSSPLIDLVGVIDRMLDGEVLLGEETKQLTESYYREARARRARLAPFDVLTHREKCVLAELMEGRSAEMIARQSCVSISTIRSQIKAILQKLGVNSQLAAAATARQAGWTLDVPTQTAELTTLTE